MSKVTRESLENGKVLKVIADMFLKDRNKKTLFTLLSCLRDSIVWIPANVEMSERDEKELLDHAEVGRIFTNQDPITYKPDILESPDGLKWLPMFSSKDEVIGDYKDYPFSYVPVDVINCVRMAHKYGANGVVLDPFTRAIDIPFAVADVIKDLLSHLEDEEEVAH